MKGCSWLLRKPFRLFTLLRFFKLNCFRLLWVGQIANVAFVFVGVFVGVKQCVSFCCFFKLFQHFRVVQVVFKSFVIVLCSLGCFTLSLVV